MTTWSSHCSNFEASKKVSAVSLLRWLEPELAFGHTFWPEVASNSFGNCALQSPSSTFYPSLDANRGDLLSNLWITILQPQVFSALTMLLPALHGYALAPEIALDASFPPGDLACMTFHDFVMFIAALFDKLVYALEEYGRCFMRLFFIAPSAWLITLPMQFSRGILAGQGSFVMSYSKSPEVELSMCKSF